MLGVVCANYIFYFCGMKNVCFLLPNGTVKMSSLYGAVELLEMANHYLISKGYSKQYHIRIAGAGQSAALYDLKTFIDFGKIKALKPDLIIIPGMHWDKWDAHKENEHVSKWVTRQYKKGCEIVSLCTGAFFLASTGLLDNLECSTHWRSEAEFRRHYPMVNLCIDKILTSHKGLYTSGGAYSSLNLVLHLIEKHNGREVALFCSKLLEIDIERSSQSPFILFDGLKDHNDELIKGVQLYVEKKVDEKITVESLADQFNMSKRNFIRRFKKVTHTTPLEYIQKIKIEKAKRELEKNQSSISEVMYNIGYNDSKAFRTTFKKVTGLNPTEYKQKFSISAIESN